ncbi:MAG: hypothetical protein D6706_11250 [Chloroflexi bacterium]|nr:MAG: hypothetical protein D6706_11250 [Chloroflexota bacterium]
MRNIAALKVSDNSVLLFGAGRPSGAAGSGNPGLECAHLQISAGALTETRVTDTVVPPFLRAPATPGNSFRYSVQAFSDTLANPGSPEHYLWFDPDADSPSSLTLLKATDSATELQIIGTSQITNSWAPPGGQPSDPSTIWTPGEVSIMIVNTQPHAQGLQITYRASTAGGLPAANKTVRFRFSNIRGAPGQQCTLVPGSSSTGTIVGNDITNVIDDGTAHTVVWDFLSDGVVDGSYAHLMAEIIRP